MFLRIFAVVRAIIVLGNSTARDVAWELMSAFGIGGPNSYFNRRDRLREPSIVKIVPVSRHG